MTEESTKPLGKPPKRDTNYVKLDNYIDESDVEGWIMRAEECVRLRGMKGDEAAGYILYHIQGGAKLELCSQIEVVTCIDKIFKVLRDRDGSCGSGERLRELVGRKQRVGECIMEFSDELFRLGMRVKEVDGWKDLMAEVFRSNVREDKLRYHLLSNTHKEATFTELRIAAQEFEYRYGGIKEIDNECYRIEQVDTDKLRKEVGDLKR